MPFYEVLEPEYNLYDRAGFDGELSEYCVKENIGVITYYSLASGFLSGKYRSEADLQKSKRGEGVAKYLNDRGMTILAALDKVAAVHSSTPAEVALAWIMAQKTVTAPIASATSVEQVELFAKAANLVLAETDLETLNKASALKV